MRFVKECKIKDLINTVAQMSGPDLCHVPWMEQTMRKMQ
jgi:hypothetical protein